MNKSVITSVSPRECELIASGKKTIEVRKTRPKIETPFKSYIYCTKGSRHIAVLQNSGGISTTFCCDWRSAIPCQCEIANGQVIGEFICDKVDAYTFSNYEAQYRINDVDLINTCLNFPELIAYGKGKILYGWHISDLKIYDKPKELGEFGNYKTEWVQWYHSDDKVFYPLTRPPQSWVYCEPIEEE